MTRQEAEQALDQGRLWTIVDVRNGGRYWKARRSGRTKTTKRNPEMWSIPVKVGFHHTIRLTNANAEQTTLSGLRFWRIDHDLP